MDAALRIEVLFDFPPAVAVVGLYLKVSPISLTLLGTLVKSKNFFLVGSYSYLKDNNSDC